MTLSDFSIRKPVFAWMLMMGLIVFGFICFLRMGISRLPDVDFPVVNIAIHWNGAAPEVIEAAVADVLEDAVMSIEGVRTVSSACQEGQLSLTVEFELNRNIDVALQEVQTRIAQVQKSLPNDIDPPIVTKSNPEDNPILWAAVTGGESLRDQALFVRDYLKNNLATVSGVGDIRFGGYVEPNMRIWLSTDRLKQHQISVADVATAILDGSILTPSGYMDHGPHESNVRVMSEAATVEEFKRLPITTRGGVPLWSTLRIGDVATVEEGLADIRRVSRLNGERAIGLGVIKQRGSNAVAVGRAVKEKVKSLLKMMPKGMGLHVVVDSVKFIEDSTRELIFTLTLSSLLTSIVCWLFLGSWSSAFNVILAIPTSLIGSFIVLNFLGFTLNTFTLLALSLSIGIVVDDAIMVLENIMRHFESGMSRVQASLVGAREITGAAIAASFAILAIFLPVIFVKGIIGKFFFQFGVTMSVAVMLSLLEALTLAPMRCSQFLKKDHDTRLGRWVEGHLQSLVETYRSLLRKSLDHAGWIIGLSVIVFVSSLFLVKSLRKEFVPPTDESRFLVTLQAPLGSSMEFTGDLLKQGEAFLKSRSAEVDSYYVALGGFQGGLVNQANIFVTLKDPSSRSIMPPFNHRPTQQEVMGLVRDDLNKIKGVTRATVLDLSLSGFSAHRGYPIQFSVQGPDWELLASISQQFMERLKKSNLVTDVDTDYYPNMPELAIQPNREKAEARGVVIANIAQTISALVSGLRVGKYTDASGHRDDVRLKLRDADNQTSTDITRIFLRNNRGEMIPLSELVDVKEKSTLLTINRFNRERAIMIFANIAAGQSQQTAMNWIEKTADEFMPQGYHIVFAGGSQAFKESFQSLLIALVLGIVVAYMVLGAQFNSFIHPLIVLLALPFSLTGAFLALYLTGISLNIYSMIGLLLLMGIVKKNSILLVDFTNIQRQSGLDVQSALLDACPLRLRPILMTSVATIVGVLPAALAFGPGAETTRPMAVVVMGGVFLSTLLTLFVVPCAYQMLSRFERHRHQDELNEALKVLSMV